MHNYSETDELMQMVEPLQGATDNNGIFSLHMNHNTLFNRYGVTSFR